MRGGCEAILPDAQDPESGGFAVARAKKIGGGLHSSVIPCLSGNLVWSLIRLGMLDDPRVQRGVEWITTYQRFEDGDGEAPTGWPYDRWEMCWGRHTCHMGAVTALKALAAIPLDQRSPEVERTLAQGAEFMLHHHVHKRSHDLAKVSKPGWRRLGFPLMYQTDVLEILDAGTVAVPDVRRPASRPKVTLLALVEFRRGAARATGKEVTRRCPQRLWCLGSTGWPVPPLELARRATSILRASAARSLKRRSSRVKRAVAKPDGRFFCPNECSANRS